MTRLILDYYRRWGLVLSLGAALQLIQGWWIKADPRTPIEFTASMIPICLGLIPLFDLSRGVVRVIGTLPLNLAKIGRGWWLANVLIPAIALVSLLFLGAGAAAFCHQSQALPWNRLAMASVVTVLWLGMMFALIFPAIFPVTGKKFSHRLRGILTVLVGAILSVVLIFWAIFGFVLSPGSANDPVKLAIFLAGGTCLTFVGWFRAGRFDPARADFVNPKTGLADKFYANKAAAAGARPTPLPTAPHQPSEGHGGIRLLLRTTFMNGLLACLTGAIGILILVWCASRFPGVIRFPMTSQNGFVINLREGFKINDPTTGAVLLMLILFQVAPPLMQLRFLRTLPISTARLAAVIIALVILPAIAAGMLTAGIAGLAFGTPAAITILKSCLLILAPIALCIFFNVWRGGGIQGYAFSMVAMMVWVCVASACRNITFPLAGAIAAAGVMTAWLLTYYALLRGGRAYRAQADPLGSLIRTVGR